MATQQVFATYHRPISPTLTNPDLILPDGDDLSQLTSQRPPSPSQLLRHANAAAPQQTSRTKRLSWIPAQQAVSRGQGSHATYSLQNALNGKDDQDYGVKGVRLLDEDVTDGGAVLSSSPVLRAPFEERQRSSNFLAAPQPGSTARRWSTTSSSVKSDDFESLESLKWPGFDEQMAKVAEDDDDDQDDEFGLDDDGEMRFGSFTRARESDGVEAEHMGNGEQTVNAADDSAALSRRADIILANAKKRLHLFEGNLHTARHSLSGTQALTMSSPGAPPDLPPLPTPPREAGRYSGLTGTVPKNGLGHDGPHGHNRGYSEVSASSFIQQLAATRNARLAQQRSVSALAHHTATQSRLLRNTKSNEIMRENRVRSWVDGVETTSLSSPPRSESAMDMHGVRRVPTSTTNDLRAQMNDLKGKISSLQQRAIRNQLYRDSFASSTSDLPYEDAESSFDGYEDEHDPGRGGRDLRYTTNGNIRNGGNGFRSASATSDNSETLYSSADEQLLDEGITHESPEPHSIMTRTFPDYDEEDSPYESTDEESVYEDVGEEPDSQLDGLAHEDRPDAFDYEHFILHSAMGAYRTDRRSSESSSGSSEDSVETTRPVQAARDEHLATAVGGSDSGSSEGGAGASGASLLNPEGTDEHVIPELHKRHPSMESIATTATFMTAEEDADSDTDRSDVDEHGMSALDRALPQLQAVTNAVGSSRDSAVGMLSPPENHAASLDDGHGDGVENGGTGNSAQDAQLLAVSPMGVHIDAMDKLSKQDLGLVQALKQSLEKACMVLGGQEGLSDTDLDDWRDRLRHATSLLDGADASQDDGDGTVVGLDEVSSEQPTIEDSQS